MQALGQEVAVWRYNGKTASATVERFPLSMDFFYRDSIAPGGQYGMVYCLLPNPGSNPVGYTVLMNLATGKEVRATSATFDIKSVLLLRGGRYGVFCGHSRRSGGFREYTTYNEDSGVSETHRTEIQRDVGRITIFDWQTGQQLHDLVGHQQRVNAACASANGSLLLTGSDDRSVRLWEVKTGKCLAAYEGHEAEVVKLTFSPDRRSFYSMARDGTVRRWQLPA
jgi:WD40 repeat protein